MGRKEERKEVIEVLASIGLACEDPRRFISTNMDKDNEHYFSIDTSSFIEATGKTYTAKQLNDWYRYEKYSIDNRLLGAN